jgi:UDP-GlcNAc:undecaprenyl-phosphate GlcNAc-1-phosphate transferase
MIDLDLETKIVAFFFALTTSLVLSGVMRKIAMSLNILDEPDGGRKTQREPVPYLGGVAIMISFVITILIGVSVLSPSREVRTDILYLLLPAAALGIIGLWDDIKELSPHFRLMVQILLGLVASLTITFGSTSGSATENQSADLLLSIFWIVGISNALNFFDNMDGGAAVASFMTTIGIVFYSSITNQPYISIFGLVLMGVLAGFFYWNRRPARIYMGDSGALFLGILLATITIRIDPQTDSKWTSFAVPVFLLALPILDTCVVVISRLINSRSPLQGGKDHLSHRLAIRGIRHRSILFIFAFTAGLFQIPIYIFLIVDLDWELAITFFYSAFFLFIVTFLVRVKIKYELD